MKLTGFKYLKRQRILTLTLIITLSSMLFSLTALSLLSFYRGFAIYLGEGEDIVVVYDRGSRTPFTGLVPIYLAERVSVLNGVLASSPEAIAPCIVRGEAVFLRGVVPGDFVKLNQIVMMEGGMLELGDLNCVIVGRNAAVRLRLNPGDEVLVLSVLTDRYVELRIKGVFASYSPIDDEILAPLHVGQWLRGAGYGYATLIRFKIDRDAIEPSRILEEIAGETSEPSTPPSTAPSQPQPPSITPRMIARIRIEDIGVEEAYDLMRSYMDRYGLTRESLLILSVMVFLFSGVSIAAASKTIIAQHKGEISILRSIGAPRRLLRMDMLAKLLPWSMASSSLGFAIAVAILAVIHGGGYLRILSHTAPIQIDLLIVALNFILTALLISISILRGGLE
jgi:ABC-type lipoprotein release transport system permease subunit